ncbi:hypothetical protein FQN49_004121 [Arthroderma sp. PD_2]|nr:hypothetical protein FQN49_004121 [Arthroderma sp. PD_2]
MTSTDPKAWCEMKVLSLGLPRTGTLSMAKALTLLGYKNVHHTLTDTDYGEEAWRVFNRAADAIFPSLPTYTGQPFSREQWDEVYGFREGATEVASVFGPQLVKAYPDAKVILVIRDYDRWFKSVDEVVIKGMWAPLTTFFMISVYPLLGMTGMIGMRKATLGFFHAKDVEEVRRNARAAYDRHHREIQEMVPPDQLLLYKMGDGWGPLCEFLGKPVPDEAFPWVNEEAELKKNGMKMLRSQLGAAALVLAPWVLGAGAVGVGSWTMAKQSGILS